MIFLIEYDPREGLLIRLDRFDDAQRSKAEDARFECELELNRKGTDHEVVLLEAASEDALRRTHRRYFEDMEHLLRRPRA